MSLSIKLPRVLLITTALLLSQASYAYADQKDDRIDAMEKQMLVMMGEIRALKAERAIEKKEQISLRQQMQSIESNTALRVSEQVSEQVTAQIANISPAAGGHDNGVKVTMSPSLKVTSGDFSWQPFGRIHLDAAAFNDDQRDHPDGAEFRRARLGMKGKVAKDFGYKAEIDFANEGVAIKSLYMNYTGIDNTEIRVGHFKPAYSMDDMTSSNDITLIERAAPVVSFSTSEQIGAGVLTHGQNWSAAAGVFNADAGRSSNDDESISIAARVTGAPINADGKLIHFGASASYRKPDQANNTFDFDERAENALQSSDSVSAVITDAQNATIYGLEAAAALGPFSLQAEYLMANVENDAGNDPSFDGWYAQGSWVLTGESRAYKASKGAFGGIKPAHAFDPSNGDWGAVELAVRYSHLDLNDNGINGGEMNNLTLGANWYLNNNMRLMANYIFVDTDNNATTPNDDPQIMLIRSQVKF